MKKLLLVLIISLSLAGCTQIKEKKMEKDAEMFIESVVNMDMLEMISYSKSLEDKYKGDDFVKFMSVLKNKIKEKADKGEDVGILAFYLIF